MGVGHFLTAPSSTGKSIVMLKKFGYKKNLNLAKSLFYLHKKVNVLWKDMAASNIISKSEAAAIVMASKSPAGDPFAERAPIWRTIKFTYREDVLTVEDCV